MGNIADAMEKAGVDLLGKPDEKETQRTESTEQQSSDNIEKEKKPPQTSPPPVNRYVGGSWDERIDLVANQSSLAAESFKMLRSRILYPQDGRERPKTIMVCSSGPSEGKSFVSVNLAVAMARGVDQHSLLVDCDLRYPSLCGLLGLNDVCRSGLTEYLSDECALEETIYKTSTNKLSLLASGRVPMNPAELLASGKMSRLIEELSGRYSDRFIVFDSPPFQVASETVVLSQHVDGVVLVIGYGKSDRSRIINMVEVLGREKIIGIVFNGLRDNFLQKKMMDPYGHYGQYYGHDNR